MGGSIEHDNGILSLELAWWDLQTIFGKAVRTIGLIVGKEMTLMHIFHFGFSVGTEAVKMVKVNTLCLFF